MERQGEVPHIRLSCRVGSESWERDKGCERRHIQDSAALSWRHGNKCRARKERQRGDIHSNLIRFAFAIKLRDLAEPSVASVVHQDLNRSISIQDAGFNLCHIGTLREVGNDRFARGTGGGGKGGDARQLITPACHQDQVVTARRQAQSNALANTRRGSRNECDWSCHKRSMLRPWNFCLRSWPAP